MGEIRIDNEHDGQVVRLTVSRPEKLNAMNSPILEALRGIFDLLSEERGLRAMVICGAGERAFIGGADIGEMADLDETDAEAFISGIQRTFRAIRDFPVPVIAEIDGFCLGAGMELAAACDIRLASTRASFAMPEVRVGLPSVIEAALIPRLVGEGRAAWLMLTGEAIDAETAAAWGFVEHLAPPEGLAALTATTLEAICAAGPEAVRMQKALLRSWQEMPPEDAIRTSIPAFARAFETGEAHRMLTGFLNRKRT